LLVLLFTAVPTKCGVISDLLGGFWGDIIDKATEGMIDNVKQAFRESMDYLFDEKILPLINQLEASADRVMDHAKDDINAIVDNFKNDLNDIVNNAVKKGEEFVDHTIEEIKTAIIDDAFDRLNSLEDKLFQDLTNVLNQIDTILKEVSCYAQAIVERITEEIKKALPSFVNPFETCRYNLIYYFLDNG